MQFKNTFDSLAHYPYLNSFHNDFDIILRYAQDRRTSILTSAVGRLRLRAG